MKSRLEKLDRDIQFMRLELDKLESKKSKSHCRTKISNV